MIITKWWEWKRVWIEWLQLVRKV